MSTLNWGLIKDGGAFESLMHAILYAEDSQIILFGRPGRDSGQDARSSDGTVVYQAKYRKKMTMHAAVKSALEELKNIKSYRQPEHSNYRHWRNANKWILVGNFEVNPNDEDKWRTKVVPEFLQAGLTAEYWGRERLERRLIAHPEIRDVFFGGENRVFVGLKEAHDLLATECVGGVNLDKSIIGREKGLKTIKEFAKFEDKRILPIVGPGGVGKSRLLYEALAALAEDGWRVLWALPYTMARSSRWFYLFNGIQPTCIAIDDPDDYNLLRTVVEQLAASERRNWKVIVACRSEKADMLRRFSTNRNVAASLSLKPLNEPSAKELLRSILGNSIQDAFLHTVYSYTRGIPGWLCLIADLVRQNSLEELPTTIDQIAAMYVESCIETLLADQQSHGRTLLRWLSLWGPVSLDISDADQPQLCFLEKQGIDKSLIPQLLKHFVTAGIVNNWGVGKRLYSIQPMIIREYILANWLLEKTNGEYQVNPEGKQLIKLLLDGNIPTIDMAYQSLSRLAYSRLEDSQAYSFLQQLFDAMVTVARDGNVIEQQRLLGLIERLGSADPENALDVLKAIRENPKENMEVDVPLWGKTTFSHAKITAKLPWTLFQLAEFVPDTTVARRYLDEFQKLFTNLQASSEPHEPGKGVQELLERLLCGSRNSTVFAGPANKFVHQELDKERLSPFVETLLKCLLNPEREYTEWIANWTLSFVKRPIVPDSNEWNIAIELRNKLFLLLGNTTNKDIRCRLWNILSESHHQFHYLISHDSVKDGVKNRYHAVLTNDLEKCAEILKSLNSPPLHLTIEEATHARKLWEWYLEYGKDTELLYLSRKCETLYNDISKWRMHEFFRFATDDELAPETKRVAKTLREAGDVSVYIEFFNEASLYLNAVRQEKQDMADGWRISSLADACADLMSFDCSTQPNVLTTFVTQVLAQKKQENQMAWVFAVRVCQKYLLNIKKTEDADLSEELTRLVNIATDKNLFLWELYSNVHPASTGKLTHVELDCILAHKNFFSNHELFALLGAFSSVDWKNVTPHLHNRLDSLRDDSVETSQCMVCFIRFVHLAALRYDWSPSQLPVARIIDIITEFQLDGALLAMHELKWLRDKANFRLSMSQLVALIRSRIDLEQQPKPYDRFKIFPHDFNVGEWCNFDTSDQTEVSAFHDLCRLALGDGFTAIYWLPKYIAQINPSGKQVADFVKNYLTCHSDIDGKDLARLGYLASAYRDDSGAWADIARPICEKASKISRKEREHVYFSLARKETGVMTSMPGEVPDEYRQAVEVARRLFDSEPSGSPLKPYRKWALERAEAELLREQQYAEEVAND